MRERDLDGLYDFVLSFSLEVEANRREERNEGELEGANKDEIEN